MFPTVIIISKHASQPFIHCSFFFFTVSEGHLQNKVWRQCRADWNTDLTHTHIIMLLLQSCFTPADNPESDLSSNNKDFCISIFFSWTGPCQGLELLLLQAANEGVGFTECVTLPDSEQLDTNFRFWFLIEWCHKMAMADFTQVQKKQTKTVKSLLYLYFTCFHWNETEFSCECGSSQSF